MEADASASARAPARKGWRVALQVLLGLLAVANFLWLLNIVAKYGNGPYLDDIARRLPRDQWILGCIVLAGVIIIFQVLLLLRFGRVPKVEWPEPEHPTEGWTVEVLDNAYRIGCKACGTVFELPIDDAGDAPFPCPNCKRLGRIKFNEPTHDAIRHVTCIECGNAFDKYHDQANCPKCGTPN